MGRPGTDEDDWIRRTVPSRSKERSHNGHRPSSSNSIASLEIRLALAAILSEFVFAGVPSGDPSLAAGLTLHPSDPIQLHVRRDPV